MTVVPLRAHKKTFNIETIDGLGSFTRAEISSMGAIIEYLRVTQKAKVRCYPDHARTKQSPICYRYSNLKEFRTYKGLSSGNKNGSLLSVIDHTLTSGGARLLEKRISAPSTILEEIEKRLACVDFMIGDESLSSNLKSEL